jgi:hypothetical protein
MRRQRDARYHFAVKSSWLDLYRNETLNRLRQLARWPRPKNDDDSDQMERLGWIVALADDDWPTTDDDDGDVTPISIEM